jgi:DNA-nicking Smr family endonuclease
MDTIQEAGMKMDKKHPTHNLPPASPLMHSPFESLQRMFDHKGIPPFRLNHQVLQSTEETLLDHPSEEQLFLEAMERVKPITKDQGVAMDRDEKPDKRPRHILEDEALSSLARLVDHGEGFVVSDTPEYIEGTGYNVDQKFPRRLRRGEYSIQAYIDLHGLSAAAAKEAFESFLKASIHSGKRAVLIIHGRGLSSPGEPILKNKIQEWLRQSYWLKRVIAYTSAQPCDGGAGATYVLLRSRPVSIKSGKARSRL